MASNATGALKALTLMDIMAFKDPNGQIAKITELLTQNNIFMRQLPFKEGNSEDGHIIARRVSLGKPTWTGYNEGPEPSVSRVTQVTETCGHLADFIQVDKRLAERSGNVGEFMLLQSKGKMEAMSQEMARTFIYGNQMTNRRSFTGLMPRLSKLNTKRFTDNPIVLDAGGQSSGNLASILLVGWGDSTVYGIYPKHSKAGMQYTFYGDKVLLKDKNGREYPGYKAYFEWTAGLCVEDPRCVVRIANIDTTDLSYDEAKAKKLFNLVIEAQSYIPEGVSLKMYAPREVWTYVSKQAAANVNRNVTANVKDARLVSDVNGIPFFRTDAMLPTEVKVTA